MTHTSAIKRMTMLGVRRPGHAGSSRQTAGTECPPSVTHASGSHVVGARHVRPVKAYATLSTSPHAAAGMSMSTTGGAARGAAEAGYGWTRRRRSARGYLMGVANLVPVRPFATAMVLVRLSPAVTAASLISFGSM